MKSNKFLLQQSGQNYLIKDAKGMTTKIGDQPTSGQNGADGADGAAGVDGKSVLTGSGDPGSGDGKDGDVFFDISNFKIFTKSGGSWNGGSLFKGNDGARGKTILEGDGPPGTNANYATPSAALTTAVSEAGFSLSDLAAGDTYMDTTNHYAYKRTASGWTKRSLTWRGLDGNNGADGGIGPAGADAVHASLTQDSYALFANPGGLAYSLTKASGSFVLRKGFLNVISASEISFYAGVTGSSTSTTSNGLTLSINSSGKYTLSGDSWSDDSETFTMRAVYSGSTYTKTYSISKSRTGLAGTDGLSLRFGSGAPLSALGNNNEVYIDTTNFKLHTKSGGAWSGGTVFSGTDGNDGANGTGVYTTTAISSGGTPASGNAYGTSAINDLLIDATNHIIYKRGLTSSTITWTSQGTQFRGATGATGPAAINGYLSNETHTSTANPDGTNYNLTGSGGTFFIFSGSTAVTATNYYVGGTGTSVTSMSNGLTCSVNSNGVYTLAGSAWTSDSESFTMRAIFSGSTITKSYNIVKNKSSKNLSLVTTGLTFSKNGAGSFYPTGQSITLTPELQNLSNTVITWTVKKIVSGTPTTLTLPNTNFITTFSGAAPYATLSSTQFNNAVGGVIGAQLQITAAHADGVEDTATISVVSDGSEADIFCVSLGTVGAATDQYVPYDVLEGGGTGLQLQDLKADVGGLIVTSSQVVAYTGSVEASTSAGYTFNFDTGIGVATANTTINHERDSQIEFTQTIFTIARAGTYRVTWQASFKGYNYDPNYARSTTATMYMLKANSGSSNYKIQDQISADISCENSSIELTTKRFSASGVSTDVTLSPAFATLYEFGNSRWRKLDYIGKYYPMSNYVSKVTNLKLEVGDKIIFKARKNSYNLISYTPTNLETWVNSPAISKTRDALEIQINANSSSDDTTDSDIDTIVMFQRIGD